MPPGYPTPAPSPPPPAAPHGYPTRASPGRPPPASAPRAAPGPTGLAPAQAIGPYRVIEEIGRGGMGVVYRAEHPALRREVALKVLIAGEHASPEALARFVGEARAVARLGHHPHIVPIHDVGTSGALHYLAMHFVDGRPLDALIRDGEIAPRRAATFARKLALALQHAHDHGLLHRDVKPQNVLVTREGEPQLTDFGLAKDVDDQSGVRTTEGTLVGSPSYMPPEQAEGSDAVDTRADVYSLGATLFHMLVGEAPFTGPTMMNIIKRVITDLPDSPRRRNPAVDRDLDAICLRCLEKEPERRYPTAGALSDDLEAWLAGRPVTAKPVGRLRRAGMWMRRNRAIAAVGAVTAIALLAASSLGVWAALEPARRRAQDAHRSQRLEALRGEPARALTVLHDRIEAASGDADALRAIVETIEDRSAIFEIARAAIPPETDEERQALPAAVGALATGSLLAHAHARLAESLDGDAAVPHWVLALGADASGRWGALARIWLAREAWRRGRVEVARAQLTPVITRSRALKLAPEDARRATVLHARVLLDLGRWEDAEEQLESLGWPTDDDGFASSTAIRTILRSFGATDEIPIPVSGRAWLGRIRLDGRTLLLVRNGSGSRAYRPHEGGLREVPSPLAPVRSSDQIHAVTAADLDGDGRDELVVGVKRASAGSGFAVVRRADVDAAWTLTAEKLGNPGQPLGAAAGDLDGDGADEVVITFSYEAPGSWLLDGARVIPFALPGHFRSGHGCWFHDVDGDGSLELLIERDVTETAGRLDVFRLGLRGGAVTGADRRLGAELVGELRGIAIDDDGLIAAAAPFHAWRNQVDASLRQAHQFIGRPVDETDRTDRIVLLRWRDGQLHREHAFVIGETERLPDRDPRQVDLGRIGGRRVILCRTLGKHARAGIKGSERRLWFVLGDDGAAPVIDLGPPRRDRTGGIRSAIFEDLDGDGDSELLLLYDDALVIRRRRDGPPPARPLDGDGDGRLARAPSDSETLLVGVYDLLTLVEVLDLKLDDAIEARIAELETRYKGSPEAREARRARILALHAKAQDAEEAASKQLAASSARRAAGARAESRRLSDAAELLHREALALLETAARQTDDALGDLSSHRLAEASTTTAYETSLVDLALDLARKRRDWRAWTSASARRESLDAKDLDRRMDRERLATLAEQVVIPGSRSEPPPLLADFPARVTRTADGFSIAVDAHSAHHVVGIPVRYDGGAFEIELDVTMRWSIWRGVMHLGLLPVDASWDRRSARFMKSRTGGIQDVRFPATVRVDTIPALEGARFRIFGARFFPYALPISTTGPVGRFPGRFRVRVGVVPEANVIWYEVREPGDSPEAPGAVLARTVAELRDPPPDGFYVVGAAFGYEEKEMLLTHGAHGARDIVTIENVLVRAVGIRPSRRPPLLRARDHVLAAGAEVLAGRPDQAVALYRGALARDGTDLHAWVGLALSARDATALVRGFQIDPYGMALAVDDALRGAPAPARRLMGSLLGKAREAIPAAADAFRGDWAAAVAQLANDDSTAARYLRGRCHGATRGADHDLLIRQHLRHSGDELPDVLWDGERAPSNVEVEKMIAEKRLAVAWVALGRRLLLDEADVAALRLRARLSELINRPARARADLRRVAELSSGTDAARAWLTYGKFVWDRLRSVAGADDQVLGAVRHALRAGLARSAIVGFGASLAKPGADEGDDRRLLHAHLLAALEALAEE